MYRKGSILVRAPPVEESKGSETSGTKEASSVETEGKGKKEKRRKPYEGISGDIKAHHEDIIGDAFWQERPWLLL